MASDDKVDRVPQALRARVDEIVALAETVCSEHLDHEYATLCRRLVAKLARKRPSPIVRGDADVWAAGALYAIGQNNFLFDPSQTPHLCADDLSLVTGVAKSTMAAKAKRIRDAVGMHAPMDPAFCRRELLAEHPLAWLVEIDGLIVDARLLPAELQAEARHDGLIPDWALDNAAQQSHVASATSRHPGSPGRQSCLGLDPVDGELPLLAGTAVRVPGFVEPGVSGQCRSGRGRRLFVDGKRLPAAYFRSVEKGAVSARPARSLLRLLSSGSLLCSPATSGGLTRVP